MATSSKAPTHSRIRRPDDHVFLLSKIPRPRLPPSASLFSLFVSTLPVSSEVALTSIFVAVYYGLSSDLLHPVTLLKSCLCLTFLGFLASSAVSPPVSSSTSHLSSMFETFSPFAMSFFYLFLCLRALSPVLSTLTTSYSDDTIYRLSLVFIIGHLLLHDYTDGDNSQPAQSSSRNDRRKKMNLSTTTPAHFPRQPLSSKPSLKPNLSSMKAVLFCTVLLSSRLVIPSSPPPLSSPPASFSSPDTKALVFILFSVLLFAFSPFLRQALRHSSPSMHVTSEVSLTVFSALLSLYVSSSPAAVNTTTNRGGPSPYNSMSYFFPANVCAILAVNAGAPLWMYRYQKYKKVMCGPWDIAHVKELGARERL